jgi:oligopeptide transport system ATP-binding protein
MNEPILSVEHLSVAFKTNDGFVHAVNDINFTLAKGKSLGIVGESGSGKSQTVLALMGLLARNGQASGRVMYQGKNLITLPLAELNAIRGNHIAMIFQDPMTSLNPYLTIETQMTEVLTLHKGMTQQAAKLRAIELLDAVAIPEAKNRLGMYPHEFSGGMRQRVMIAMSLLCQPDILIADEPTTALDVTVQAQILSLLKDLQRDFNTSIIMITHDLGVVAGLCDDVMVMYGGQTMEKAPTDQIFYQASHPYTQGLLAAIPKLNAPDDAPLLSIPGNPPNMNQIPKGCPFSPRCGQALPVCQTEKPTLIAHADDGTFRACHLPL